MTTYYFDFEDGSNIGTSNVVFEPGTLSGATKAPPNGLMQGVAYSSINWEFAAYHWYGEYAELEFGAASRKISEYYFFLGSRTTSPTLSLYLFISDGAQRNS